MVEGEEQCCFEKVVETEVEAGEVMWRFASSFDYCALSLQRSGFLPLFLLLASLLGGGRGVVLPQMPRLQHLSRPP